MRNWIIHSPRSVSTVSICCSSRCSRKSISSVVIDLDFTMSRASFLLGELSDKVGDIAAIARVDDLASALSHLGFEKLQVIIEILDGVLLDLVRLLSPELKFLGQRIGKRVLRLCIRRQWRNRSRLKPGVIQDLADLNQWTGQP